VPRLPVTVVGIGADGWAGLARPSQDALRAADVVLGGERQLHLLPGEVGAARRGWPTPMVPALGGLLDEHRDQRVAVLASGDPLFFGIGSSLVRLLGTGTVHVLPHLSSVTLACARLGWPAEDVEVLSAVGRPLETLHPAVQPGRRVLVLVSESEGAARVVELLCARGYGASPVVVLEQLGGPSERVVVGTAAAWAVPNHDVLAVVAVECRAAAGVAALPRTPGLPDEAFEHDGQLTKREVRALTLAALAPVPGELLWDVGAGSGSVGIEWLRTNPACRAIAVEPHTERRARIVRNAATLGVPGLQVVAGAAPAALAALPVPDAIFVGGGSSAPGVLAACVAAVRAGGRLVVNAVTVETEAVLAGWQTSHGGALTRIAIQRAAPVGGFTGWFPAMPVTQWSYRKGDS
jgi:precorrin-6Y C5,15-methyltransferase (decarboxylating)